ncbi:MAG: hypothetical protein J3K34DRAFT_515821 [Monoraphidium minutum]|nr:MAG: hypothetical protein J3K34DRAFT_515821 [Monoraphidium minutum]
MARAAAGFTPPDRGPAPPLTALQYALCALGVPLMAVMFAFGILGLIVMMDPQGTGSVSQTQFAQQWKWLVNKNLFFQPFAVNFGAIGLIFCISRLVSHHKLKRGGGGAKGVKAE